MRASKNNEEGEEARESNVLGLAASYTSPSPHLTETAGTPNQIRRIDTW